MPQWLTDQEMRSWRAYVITKPLLERQLHRELVDRFGVTLADYEVLVRLSEMPDRRMRMSDLAQELGVSKSKVSHQISRMERAGTVRRAQCDDDARGVLAELTDEGMRTLTEAAPTHVAGVREHMIDLMTPQEQLVVERVFNRMAEHLNALPK
jgi:DNA-binding MarR family transcriptional regulator